MDRLNKILHHHMAKKKKKIEFHIKGAYNLKPRLSYPGKHSRTKCLPSYM